jgi:cytosine/adenosine deaminase-related metal-dependent hydrolase
VTLASQNDARDRILAASDDDSTIVFRGAHIVTMTAEHPIVGDLVVRAGRIEAVGSGLAERYTAAIEVDASRHIITPGLIDCHVHGWEAQLRGVSPDAGHSNYVALTHAGFAPHYRPEDLAVAERLTAARALNAGTTTIIDNSHNTRSREHADAAVEALLGSGIRAVWAPANGQIGEHVRQLPADLLRLREEYPVSGEGLVTLRMYDEHPSVESWRFADENGFDLCLELGPWTPDVLGLARSGLMRPGHTYNHAAGIPSEVWQAIADSGAAVNLCPRSDTQFGLGAFAPVLEAGRHGVHFGISTDNEIAYGHDLFSEMRTLLAVQRGLLLQLDAAAAEDAPPRMTALDVLDAATRGGAINAGLPDEIGAIAAGMRADLVLHSLDDVTTALSGSIVGTVVNYAGIGTVDAVLVDGRLAKWGGELVGIDYAGLLRAAERSREHLFEAAGVSEAEVGRGLMPTMDLSRADDTARAYLGASRRS